MNNSTLVKDIKEDVGSVGKDVNLEEKADITQGQLQTLLKRIEKLESGDTRPTYERPKYHTALIRFFDGKMVVGYGKSWDERNIEGEWRRKSEIMVQDGKDVKIKKVDFLDFMKSGEEVRAKILNIEKTDKREYQGTTTLKDVKYDAFRTVDTGVEVPLEVNTPDYIYEMELPDGTKVKLSHEALN